MIELSTISRIISYVYYCFFCNYHVQVMFVLSNFVTNSNRSGNCDCFDRIFFSNLNISINCLFKWKEIE